MARAISEHGVFKPKAPRAETRADITDHAARAIIRDEASRREAKTARLRQARLENEAKLAAEPPAKPGPKKGRPTRRAKSSA